MCVTISLLGQQHQEVLAKIADLQTTLNLPAPALHAYHAYLSAEVTRHFSMEEDALLPVLGRYLSLSRGPLAVIPAERAELQRCLEDLATAIEAGAVPKQQDCAREIIALLRAHIAREDNVLFPLAVRMLSADELAEIERRASCRSEPHQPESCNCQLTGSEDSEGQEMR